ncbi:MAG: hypothetical protein IJ960_00940 [Oscillospiraceae bacterium]|nr:hypothetical protein [Oscillospiraceae bacterium]
MKLFDMLLGQEIFGGGAAGGGSDLPEGVYVCAGFSEHYELDDMLLTRCGDYLELPNIDEFCNDLGNLAATDGVFYIVYAAGGNYTSKEARGNSEVTNELFLEYMEDGVLAVTDLDGNFLLINTPNAMGDVPPGLYTVDSAISPGYPVMLVYQYTPRG